MVLEHRGEYPSLRAAIDSMAPKIGCVPQTLRTSVKRHEVYSRLRDGHHVEVQRLKQLERENEELRQRASEDFDLVGRSSVISQLRQTIEKVAPTGSRVLITGPAGSGKEVVARYIHNHSARRNGPFVAINCAAIPDSLLEATLFGYEKGAFTGAQQAQAGKFEQAQNGTLLLDEVTEMPLGLQAKLLRVLQEREVERVGGKKPVALDIRIVATSNRDMAEAVNKGILREDVYYRLNVFPLLIPALRQRPEDIVPLARHFLVEHGGRSGRPGLRLSSAAEAVLMEHAWPGNVRELENVMQRAVILAAADVVEADALHLSPGVFASGALRQSVTLEVPVDAVIAVSADGQKSENMRDLEREHILETLSLVGGSRKLAGERVGMSERTLRHKLKQYREAGQFSE